MQVSRSKREPTSNQQALSGSFYHLAQQLQTEAELSKSVSQSRNQYFQKHSSRQQSLSKDKMNNSNLNSTSKNQVNKQKSFEILQKGIKQDLSHSFRPMSGISPPLQNRQQGTSRQYPKNISKMEPENQNQKEQLTHHNQKLSFNESINSNQIQSNSLQNILTPNINLSNIFKANNSHISQSKKLQNSTQAISLGGGGQSPQQTFVTSKAQNQHSYQNLSSTVQISSNQFSNQQFQHDKLSNFIPLEKKSNLSIQSNTSPHMFPYSDNNNTNITNINENKIVSHHNGRKSLQGRVNYSQNFEENDSKKQKMVENIIETMLTIDDQTNEKSFNRTQLYSQDIGGNNLTTQKSLQGALRAINCDCQSKLYQMKESIGIQRQEFEKEIQFMQQQSQQYQNEVIHMKRFQDLYKVEKEAKQQCEKSINLIESALSRYKSDIRGLIFDIFEIALIASDLNQIIATPNNTLQQSLSTMKVYSHFSQTMMNKSEDILSKMNPFIIDLDMSDQLNEFRHHAKENYNQSLSEFFKQEVKQNQYFQAPAYEQKLPKQLSTENKSSSEISCLYSQDCSVGNSEHFSNDHQKTVGQQIGSEQEQKTNIGQHYKEQSHFKNENENVNNQALAQFTKPQITIENNIGKSIFSQLISPSSQISTSVGPPLLQSKDSKGFNPQSIFKQSLTILQQQATTRQQELYSQDKSINMCKYQDNSEVTLSKEANSQVNQNNSSEKSTFILNLSQVEQKPLNGSYKPQIEPNENKDDTKGKVIDVMDLSPCFSSGIQEDESSSQGNLFDLHQNNKREKNLSSKSLVQNKHLNQNSIHYQEKNEENLNCLDLREEEEEVNSEDESNKTVLENFNKKQIEIEGEGEHVIAAFNFKAQKENDLEFSKGDKIQVLKKTENGWWIGICNNKIGYFPYNFVCEIQFC